MIYEAHLLAAAGKSIFDIAYGTSLASLWKEADTMYAKRIKDAVAGDHRLYRAWITGNWDTPK